MSHANRAYENQLAADLNMIGLIWLIILISPFVILLARAIYLLVREYRRPR